MQLRKDLDPNNFIKTLDIYFFILKSENFKAFTIYKVLMVYHMVHTENDGAPCSDKKPAQTGSSYQCSVSIYIATAAQSTSELKNASFNSVQQAGRHTVWTNDSLSVFSVNDTQ